MVFSEVLRIIFGGIVLLFLPGFVWSFAVFKKNQVDMIERIVFSFGFSVMVSLTALVLNYILDVSITLANFLLISIAWTSIPFAFLLFERLLKKAETKA